MTRWDDETGDADIVEYDQSGRIICRHEWRLSTTTGDRHAAAMVTFDRQGRETGRRPLMHGGADEASPSTSG